MFEDVINGLADALGTTEGTAQFVLASAIILAIVLALSAAQTQLVGVAGVVIIVVLLFTVIGWIPLFVAAVVIIITGGIFATMIATWMGAGD